MTHDTLFHFVGDWFLRFWRIRILRFFLVGALNTVFGYGVFAFFILMGLHYVFAAFLSTVMSILFNFKTTGTIVFGSHDNRLILRFFGVYAFNYVLGVSILKIFKMAGVHVLVTAAVSALPLAILSFMLMRHFVFDRQGERIVPELKLAVREIGALALELFKDPADSTHIQFFRYAFVGGIAFLFDFGILYALTEFAGVYYLVSATLSFLAGLAVNYTLSVAWVFTRHTLRSRWLEFWIFVAVGVVGLGLNDLFMWLFTGVAGMYFLYSKIVATVLVFLWNFFARKLSLFR